PDVPRQTSGAAVVDAPPVRQAESRATPAPSVGGRVRRPHGASDALDARSHLGPDRPFQTYRLDSERPNEGGQDPWGCAIPRRGQSAEEAQDPEPGRRAGVPVEG